MRPTSVHRLVAAALAGVVTTTALVACDREQRTFRESPPAAQPAGIVRVSQLQPGPTLDSMHVLNPNDRNAYAVSEGQRLFTWYNCSGCHANGGGGMGPPLIDDEWRYGAEPQNIYDTIVEGRPNGMPSFRQKLTPQQVWQLTAYVRSISGLVPLDAANGRRDHMWVRPPENMKVEEKPTPEQAEHPE
jgi:cytochrome c oxidase cbb3-type subunit III